MSSTGRSRHAVEPIDRALPAVGRRSSYHPPSRHAHVQRSAAEDAPNGTHRNAVREEDNHKGKIVGRHESSDKSETTTEPSYNSSSPLSQPSAGLGNGGASELHARQRLTSTSPARMLPGIFVDPRFSRLDPSAFKKFFRVGCVFAIKSFDEDGGSDFGAPSDDYSWERLRSRHGHPLVTKVRRMVVVLPKDGCCLVIPINTYGLQGLKKTGLRESNINAHAIIHMEGEEAQWLENEPHSPKHDIAVRPHDALSKLHPSSRICFERTHTVNYNERLMKIGTVTRSSLPYLLQYWSEETTLNALNGKRGKPR